MWRRKYPKEYRIEVRDYEEKDGKFLASLECGNMVHLECVGDFLFQKNANKSITHLDGCRQVLDTN